jgi:hypothetical protein
MKEITFSFWQLLFYNIMQFIYPNYKNTNNTNYTNYINNTNNYKKQIFWECGGGYWSYYSGIVKMIKETYSKDILDKIVWMGSSAGVFPCLISEYDEKTDNLLNYIKNILLCLPQYWYGGLYNFNSIILEKFHKEYLYQYKSKILNPQQKMFITVLNINIICPFLSTISLCYDFDNINIFSETCMASHGIPFLMGPLNNTLLNHPDKNKWYIKRMDAGVFTLLFGFIFGYKCFMPYGPKLDTKIIYPHIFRPYNLKYLWIHSNMIHNMKLFELGYQDALKNREKIDNIIL